MAGIVTERFAPTDTTLQTDLVLADILAMQLSS